MHNAPKNSISDRWVANHFMPLFDWELACDYQRFTLVSFFDDLEEVVPLFIGLQITEEQCRDMLEDADDRAGCGSTKISSQLPVKEWYQTFANATLADAILDRVHGSYRLEISGPTRRAPANKEN